MVHECALRVRTYECDGYGHVNNSVYLNYLEYARGEFLDAIGFDYPGLMAAGFGTYIARIEIDYKRPAFPGDELTVRSTALKRGAISGVIGQTLFRGAEVVADAKVTWAFVDKNGVPTRIPPRWNVPGLAPDPALGAAGDPAGAAGS
jgi:acyl-CoA thioester hydrolase